MNKINLTVPGIFPRSHLLSGFTSRLGGVSVPPFDSLNLGFDTADERNAVLENHTILYSFIGLDHTNVALMEQVHGSHIRVVGSGGIFPATDGLITSKRGIMLGIKCADCIPLLLFDPVRMIAGAIHCGWRPLTESIAGKALSIMARNFGCYLENILATAGPSAGPCCYEIGDDVAEHLQPASVTRRNGKLYADLRAELRQHLLDSGLKHRNIEIIPDCTVCNKSLYFSHRRDGSLSGRMLGYIIMKDDELCIMESEIWKLKLKKEK